MKNANEKELLIKFKDLENKLIEVLKIDPIELSDSESKATIKKHIKDYIKRVEDAKKILAEYENVAEQLNVLNNEISKDNEVISKAVIGLRKEPKVKIEELGSTFGTEKYVDEDLIIDGKVVGTKKKRKSTNKSKEL